MTQPLSFHDAPPGDHRGYGGHGSGGGGKPRQASPAQTGLLVALGSALLGAVFSFVSTSDFIAHLDRQVHSIHCSFVPGMGAEIGESGCRTVMLSPYSSLFRESLWGGIPISLLSVAVFAYLVMRAGTFLLQGNQLTKRETTFFVAAWALPVVMSVIYGFLAATQLGALCKLCVGVYLASAGGFVGALMAHGKAPAAPRGHGSSNTGAYARWFGEGVLYVAVMAVFYVMFVPTSEKSQSGCGSLVQKEDTGGFYIPMNLRSEAEQAGSQSGSSGSGTPAIAVLDPLCPACKGFDDRVRASSLDDNLAINAVLFPLDSTCNWMVKDSLHPGACAVSEAMLCDKDGAMAILDWAFTGQEDLRATAKEDERKLRRLIEEKFPKVKGCLGSAQVKNKLNKSLRWAVQNALPVLTPQLFVGDRRVCDEDTDLGLEYTVAQMLEAQESPRKRR